MSYGDITQGGVGTATSVCDGGVVGFGHPATFLGTTTLSLHPADALYVQEDPVGPSFKVANFGEPVGTISGDHLSGVSGTFGALPATTTITSDLSYRDRQRDGPELRLGPRVERGRHLLPAAGQPRPRPRRDRRGLGADDLDDHR